jgi:thioredoxin 1
MHSIEQISTVDFPQKVLRSEVPVLIDFYADWCGPCRMLSPRLERLAGAFAGKARVFKVNVEQEPDLARHFHVDSIPTLVFVHRGRLVGRMTGLVPEANLSRALKELTGRAGAGSLQAG